MFSSGIHFRYVCKSNAKALKIVALIRCTKIVWYPALVRYFGDTKLIREIFEVTGDFKHPESRCVSFLKEYPRQLVEATCNFVDPGVCV